MNKELQRKIIQNPKIFKSVKNKTSDITDIAIRLYPENIKYASAENLNQKICIDVVKKFPGYIEYIPEEFQNRTVVLDAIQSDPMLIKFVKKQNEQYQLKAVSNDGMALAFCRSPSKKVISTAIRNNGKALEFIDINDNNNYINLVNTALKQNPEVLTILFSNPLNSYKILSADYSNRNKLENIFIAAIKRKPTLIKSVPKMIRRLFPRLEEEAIRVDADVVKYCDIMKIGNVVNAIKVDQNNISLLRHFKHDEMLSVINNINIKRLSFKNKLIIYIFKNKFFGAILSILHWIKFL